MDLISLELQNFGSYKNETISFAGLHIAGLFGANGSGKTTLTEAISWALFGKGPKSGRRNDADCYVNDSTTECAVTLVFELNNMVYKVHRTWNKDERKGQLNFTYQAEDWVQIGNGKRDVQNEIIKTLGMDYKTFIASVFAPQGQSDSLTSDNLDDMEKKEIISTILGLGFWADLLKKAQEEGKEKQKELDLLTAQIEPLKALVEKESTVKAELETKSEALKENESLLAETTSAIVELEKYFVTVEKEKESQKRLIKDKEKKEADFKNNQKEISTEEEALTKEIDDLKTRINEATEKVKNLQSILSQKDEIESKYSQLEALTKEICGFEEKLTEHNRIYQAIIVKEKEEAEWKTKQKEVLSGIHVQLERDRQAAALLDKVNCPQTMKDSCPLLQSARNAKKSLPDTEEQYGLLKTFKSPHTEKITILKTELKKVGYDEAGHNKKKEELKKLQRYTGLKIELNSALTEDKHLQHDLKNYEKQLEMSKQKLESLMSKQNSLIKVYQKEIAILEEEIEKIDQNLVQYDKNQLSLTEKKETVAALKQEINLLREEIGALKQQQDQIKAAKKDVVNYQEKHDKLFEEIEVLKIIEKAAHKKSGVPLFIIENTRPQIECLTNDLLERITDGRFSISIETQVETKTTENIQEVFKIFVYDAGRPRPYHQLSGAEKFIIDISIRVGICKFLARRSGTAIKIFIIDEGLSSLDEENRPRILKAIFEIGKEFNKVFIITHIVDFQNMLGQRIHFTKTPNGTKVTIVK